MYKHEIIFIAKPEQEKDVKFILADVEYFMEKYGYEQDTEIWGKRKLAYPIKSFKEGIYCHIDCWSDSSDNKKDQMLIVKLNDYFNKSEEVMKHIIVNNTDL